MKTSAADLKFLHRLRQTHSRNFKSKSGTRIICLLVPLLLPKFVSEGAAMYHELRKRGTRGKRSCRPSPRLRRPGPRSSPSGLSDTLFGRRRMDSRKSVSGSFGLVDRFAYFTNFLIEDFVSRLLH